MRFSPFFSPHFDWIQVELTTYCNAACIYCPRTAYKNSWIDRHLPLEFFMKLKPLLSKARHLHLQGWGEPFLHPDFFKMASLAKKAGLQISTTTNGMLLDQERSVRLIETGIDIIAFSLAGADAHSNDAIRKGTRWSKIIKAIETLGKEKIKRARKEPAIHIAYLVLRSGLKELKRIPRLFAEMGVSQVVLSTLDFVASEELVSQTIRPSSLSEYQETESYFRSIVGEGEKRGISIHYYLPPFGREGIFCKENVQKAFCLAADGAVTPCVYTNLPVSGEFHYLPDGKRPYTRLSFGSIQEKSPLAIWAMSAYKDFRHSFSGKGHPTACTNCPKLSRA